jgi:large repetitive protein
MAGPALADGIGPTNSDPPSISGPTVVGDVLTADPGTWSGDTPITFTYQWSNGQTSSTDTLSAADLGDSLTVMVTATNDAGQASVTSASVGPVLPAPPVNDTAPVITGTPQQNETLSVSDGTWENDPSLAYAWDDCDGSGNNCVAITGATSSSYTLQASDVGSTIVAVVTGSNDGGQVAAASTAVGPVAPAAPVNSGVAPSIGGTAQQGDTLTVSNGAWSNDPSFTYAWEDCDGSGNNCVAITGATSSSYTLQASDVGSTIVVVVTGSNDGGQGVAYSAPTDPVLEAAPVNTGPSPSIGGTAQQGDTLTVGDGAWSNSPSFTYGWEDCNGSGNNCVAIAGATSSSYTLQASDVGSTIVAVVTGSNAGGQSTADSAPTDPVLEAAPGNTGAPVINGTPQQGDKLSVINGTWSGAPSFTYAWEDCDDSGNNCVAIPGASSNSYTLQASDVGSTVVAVATGSNAGGQLTVPSGPVGPVVPAAPVNSRAPAISGTAQQGATLSVSNGTWSNNPSFTYVWQDCASSGSGCVAIPGATSSTYELQPSDVGEYVSATVTASNGGGDPAVTSATVGPVLPAAPVDTVAPGISGTAQQGDTLSVSEGSWSNNPAKYTYAWEDCASPETSCSAISGASSSGYTLQAADVGKYLSVIVTASNTGGAGAVTTASVGPVLPPPPANTEAPAITGTTEEGDTVSVSNGSWTNAPTSYTYAWEDCNSSGSNCSAIAGATASSYALSGVDVGKTIECVVTARGPGGSTSATAAKTAAVIASPIPPASQPTTTSLLATPGAPVTNQSVTLVATVTAGASSTGLWGDVTFENGAAPVPGCANLAVAPSGESATVACSTSFRASTVGLSAVFTPASGSILKGSTSQTGALKVSPDSSSTALAASSSVNVGSSTTYTASVTPPAARPGPIEPTGAVEFLDGGQPIASCGNQPLANGQASCTVTYTASGTHQITAEYSGDANFIGSSSPAAQVSAASVATTVVGAITSTMQWSFYYTPKFTVVQQLFVNGAVPGATVLVQCHGHGCPFARHAILLPTGKRCGRNGTKMCSVGGGFNITPGFVGRHLKVGAQITISIVRPNWTGKAYRFTVRSRRGPRIQIGCLAPSGRTPNFGC